MVVLGAVGARSEGGGRGSEGGAVVMREEKMCSVARQRQHTYLQLQGFKVHHDKLASDGGEFLPVVELKPFTKKVWSREKSLPNFYDKLPAKSDESGTESSRHSPRPQARGPTPQVARYIRELSEQGRATELRESAESTQRYRSKLHPKADFHFESVGVAAHQQDLIPSFTTRAGRTRTTLGEETGVWTSLPAPSDMSGADADRSAAAAAAGGIVGLAGDTSSLLSAFTRNKRLLQQQRVVLMGGHLPVADLGRRRLLYLQPSSGYKPKQHERWNGARSVKWPTSSVAADGLRSRQASSLPLSPRDSEVAVSPASDNGHYIQLGDLVLSGIPFHGPERSFSKALRPVRAGGPRSPHRFHGKLGAAQDSLLLLSRTGAPTVLERVLSRDQEIRLERCRRERSFAAVSETNVLSTAHYVAYDSQPTRGERTLIKARHANMPPQDWGVGNPPGQGYRRHGPRRRHGPQGPGATRHARLTHPRGGAAGGSASEPSDGRRSDLGVSGTASVPGDKGHNPEPLLAPSSQPPPPRLLSLGSAPIPETPVEPEIEGAETAALVTRAPAESVTYAEGDDRLATTSAPRGRVAAGQATQEQDRVVGNRTRSGREDDRVEQNGRPFITAENGQRGDSDTVPAARGRNDGDESEERDGGPDVETVSPVSDPFLTDVVDNDVEAKDIKGLGDASHSGNADSQVFPTTPNAEIRD